MIHGWGSRFPGSDRIISGARTCPVSSIGERTYRAGKTDSCRVCVSAIGQDVKRGVSTRLSPVRRGSLPSSICCLSSFGRAPSWYLGGGWIEATRQHHASVAELAYAAVSETVPKGWEFKSPRSHQICPFGEMKTQQAQTLWPQGLGVQVSQRAPFR